MNDLDLPSLKKLCEAATPGPWKHDMGNHQIEVERDREPICDACTSWDVGMLVGSPRRTHDDMEFIAAARTAVPQLIAKVEELDRYIDNQTEIHCVDGNEHERLEYENAALKAEIDRLNELLDDNFFSDMGRLRKVKEARKILEENVALKAEVERLKSPREREVEMVKENQALRELLGQARNGHYSFPSQAAKDDLLKRIAAVLK